MTMTRGLCGQASEGRAAIATIGGSCVDLRWRATRSEAAKIGGETLQVVRAWVMPRCDTGAINLHLAENRARRARRCAGRSGRLASFRPADLTLVPLPAKCPELDPQENVWQFMCDYWLSNRIFDAYDQIVDHYCDAWNKLVDQRCRIMSIGTRQWANGADQRELVTDEAAPETLECVSFGRKGGKQGDARTQGEIGAQSHEANVGRGSGASPILRPQAFESTH
jgi:hypothetical protein